MDQDAPSPAVAPGPTPPDRFWRNVGLTALASFAAAAIVAASSAASGPLGDAVTSAELLLFLAWGPLCWRVVRRRTGWERTAWIWFTAAFPAMVLGAGAIYLSGRSISATPSGDPLESIVEVALYGVLFVGLLLLGYGQSQSRATFRRAIDAAIIAGSLFFVLWGLLYETQFERSMLGVGARVATLIVPFLDVALLTVGALALTVPDPARPKGYRYLMLGLAVLFLGDVVGSSLILLQSRLLLPAAAASGVGSILLLCLAAYQVGREQPWQVARNWRAPFWSQVIPLLALLPAVGMAVQQDLAHGGLSPIQFWNAVLVIGLVMVQLALTLAETSRLRRQIEGESAFKTQLLRFISHEVANPLSPLRVQAMVLKAHSTAADSKGWGIMDRSIERLSALSRDVREMALAETQRLVTVVESIDLGGQVAAAAESAAVQARQAGLQLTLQAAPEPLQVRIDRQRFGQILDNLLSNALKYTPAPGSIQVTVTRVGDQARVEVRDSGLGLSAEQQAHLFQPFGRAHDGTIPGLGLGLYLCRAIMAELQGGIGVRSDGPGQGSVFWVTLPLDQPGARGLPALTPRMPDLVQHDQAATGSAAVRLP